MPDRSNSSNQSGSGLRASSLLLPSVQQKRHVVFQFDGTTITAVAGQSIAAALIAAGIAGARRTEDGALRGYYCGMGVCWECVVAIEGRGHVRACAETVQDRMHVHSVTAARRPDDA